MTTITIDKAIEILSDLSHGGPIPHPQDNIDAIKLGIEALKRIKAQYDPDHQMMRIPLPGETKE